MRRLTQAALAAIALLLFAPLSAHAEPQASIEPRQLTLSEALAAGSEGTLPPLTVTNVGDAAGTFVVEIRSPSDPGATPPEAAWLRVAPAEFELAPGAAQSVTVTAAPVDDVEEGPYRVLVTAGTRGTDLAVAATIELDVATASSGLAAGLDARVYVALLAVAVLALLLFVLARRLQFNLGVLPSKRDTEAVAAGRAEPSRSVLLNAPRQLGPALAVSQSNVPEPERGRPWMTDFSDTSFERPARPSMDNPSLPVARVPAEPAIQVPLPAPLQPSVPPPTPEPAVLAEESRTSYDPTPRHRRRDWLTLGSLALGAGLAVWAAVATFMLATRPEVDRGAIDARIAALEAQISSLTTVSTPADGDSAASGDGVEVAAGPSETPPSELAAAPPTEEEITEATPEQDASEPAEAEATPEATPPSASQALQTEQPVEPVDEAPPVQGGDTWNVGPSGERIYFAGPGGGPLDTAGQDLYDCHNFETWAQALAVLQASGPGDPNLIDTDGNGTPCESLLAREQAG